MGTRAIAIIVALIAIKASADRGSSVLTYAMNLTRSAVAQWELSHMRGALLGEHRMTGEVPPEGDPDALAAHLAGFFETDGAPKLDPWDRPYELVSLGEGDFVLLSVGSNGVRDANCVDGGAQGGDDVCTGLHFDDSAPVYALLP